MNDRGLMRNTLKRFFLTSNAYLFLLLFFSLSTSDASDKICSSPQLTERMWSMNCGPQPRISGKSEFHLVGYSYSITRVQQAKLKCMLKVGRQQWRRVDVAGGICPRALAERGRRKRTAVIFCDTKYTKIP